MNFSFAGTAIVSAAKRRRTREHHIPVYAFASRKTAENKYRVTCRELKLLGVKRKSRTVLLLAGKVGKFCSGENAPFMPALFLAPIFFRAFSIETGTGYNSIRWGVRTGAATEKPVPEDRLLYSLFKLTLRGQLRIISEKLWIKHSRFAFSLECLASVADLMLVRNGIGDVDAGQDFLGEQAVPVRITV